MPTVTSPEQLFEHELQDMYYAEKTLTKVLPKLADEASDRELSRAFTSHLKETEGHVANLEKVFKKMGKTPQATPCPVPDLGPCGGDRTTGPTATATSWMRDLDQAHIPIAASKSGHDLVDVSVAGLALDSRLQAQIVKLSSHPLGLCHAAQRIRTTREKEWGTRE